MNISPIKNDTFRFVVRVTGRRLQCWATSDNRPPDCSLHVARCQHWRIRRTLAAGIISSILLTSSSLITTQSEVVPYIWRAHPSGPRPVWCCGLRHCDLKPVTLWLMTSDLWRWPVTLWPVTRDFATGGGGGGHGGQDSGPLHFWKPRGRPPQKFGYFSVFFLKRTKFCIFQHFQNKVAVIRGETKFWC